MVKWLMRKLPKRVLKVGNFYYPQVWLIWWHYVYHVVGYDSIAPREYTTLEAAINMLNTRWRKQEKPEKSVVWRGR